jgi:chemotaxis methyl-accepting protein methylase
MQDRVVENFSNAMMPNGFLAIGVKENLANSRKSNDFIVVCQEENIFRKK